MISILNDKIKKISTLKKEIKTQKSLSEPYKPGQRSQTCNPLNFRPGMNQVFQSLTKLILISQSKSNREQQLKKTKKARVILKMSGKSQRKQTNKNNLKHLSQIKQIAIKRMIVKFKRKIK